MDKTRTIYKLRKYKNSILMSLITLTVGVLIFSIINLFEKQIISLIHANILQLSVSNGGLNESNNTIDISYKIFSLFEKGTFITILFSLECFIMIFAFIRLSSRTPKFSKMSPIILGIGTLILTSYYFISAFSLSINGFFSNYQLNNYWFLKLIGFILIILSNIIFIQQIFKQVVLEKDLY